MKLAKMKKAFSWSRVRRDALVILLAGAAIFTARSSLADHYYVPSGSMLPTVHIDDRILVNKLAYGFRIPLFETYAVKFGGPSRGDVVVLASPEDDVTLLKRVVAVPGDRVSVVDGQLELNGRIVPLELRRGQLLERLGRTAHPLDLEHGGGPDIGPITVPEGHFLVLGDNRGNSHDGRMFGFVEQDAIIGRATEIFLRDGHLTWLGL
jgi:signal peptidase I